MKFESRLFISVLGNRPTFNRKTEFKNFVVRGKLAGFENTTSLHFLQIFVFPSSFLPHHFFLTIGFAMAPPSDTNHA
jgi:hypothetical protein